jgi:hypothetical protein
MSGQPDQCKLCARWVYPESLAFYAGLNEDQKQDYCAGCGSFVGVEDNDDPPLMDVQPNHPTECICRDCIDLLRHNHDRAQAQAFELLCERDQIAKELRAMADRLSRRTS